MSDEFTEQTTEVESRIDILYQEARGRFEIWAGMDAPHLPGVPVDAMQVRLARWQRNNFGATPDERIALGCGEELGEVFEADSLGSAIDGVGDVCVYLGQIFTANRMALGPALVAANEAYALIVAEGSDDDPAVAAIKAIGYLNHVTLKRAQKIRGMDSDDEFRRALFQAGVDLVLAATLQLADVHGDDAVMEARGVVGIYLTIGERVAARDWKKDPKKGGES